MQTCLHRKEEAALGILQPVVEAGRLFASRDKPNLLCGARGNGSQGGSLGTSLSRAVPAPEHFQGTKRARSSPEEPFPGVSWSFPSLLLLLRALLHPHTRPLCRTRRGAGAGAHGTVLGATSRDTSQTDPAPVPMEKGEERTRGEAVNPWRQ